jgi:hypothetical protein
MSSKNPKQVPNEQIRSSLAFKVFLGLYATTLVIALLLFAAVIGLGIAHDTPALIIVGAVGWLLLFNDWLKL